MIGIPYEKRLKNLSSLIGNTPLLEIKFTYKQKERRIFAKAEHLNMTGSIKDRMAFHVLKKAFERGALKPNHTIIEAQQKYRDCNVKALIQSI